MLLQARIDERVAELQRICIAPLQEGHFIAEAHGVGSDPGSEAELATLQIEAGPPACQSEFQHPVSVRLRQRVASLARGEKPSFDDPGREVGRPHLQQKEPKTKASMLYNVFKRNSNTYLVAFESDRGAHVGHRSARQR